jgi:hypothetical protein
MEQFRLDRTKIKISSMQSEEPSVVYWRTQSPIKALEAIQFLRIQFHPELNDPSTRLQRVYRITQR